MQFKKILVPVDFSHFSKKALEAAVKLARCCKGKIHLIHVEEDIFRMKRIHEVHPPLEAVCDKFHEDYVLEEKKQLEKFIKYVPKDIMGKVAFKEGHPFVEIIKYAKDQCMDLIVLSERGRSNVKHALLGSTTDKVSRKSNCPVLIIKDKRCKFVAL